MTSLEFIARKIADADLHAKDGEPLGPYRSLIMVHPDGTLTRRSGNPV